MSERPTAPSGHAQVPGVSRLAGRPGPAQALRIAPDRDNRAGDPQIRVRAHGTLRTVPNGLLPKARLPKLLPRRPAISRTPHAEAEIGAPSVRPVERHSAGKG